MYFKQLYKHRGTLLYGVFLAALLLLLKWLEFRLLIVRSALDIYIGAIALLFTSLGIWLALKLARPVHKEVISAERAPDTTSAKSPYDDGLVVELNISKREMDVLNLMAEGLSNSEIAGRLFVSLNTVKTHCSSLYEKLEVKRRTQAIEKAKRLRIIA